MKYILILLIAIGGYHWYSNSSYSSKGFTGQAHNRLIMYSLTTCGFCKQKAKDLRSEGISFVEYFIDKDRYRQEELYNKLAKSGYPPKTYGMPTFDAYGYMLPNNPSISKILSYQDKS